MSRNKRVLTILLSGALLSLFLIDWTLFPVKIGTAPVALGFLLLVSLSAVSLRFSACEILLFTLVMTPFLYNTLHFFSGLLPRDAYFVVLRCGLALIFYRLIVSFLESIRSRNLKIALLIATSIAVPLLWSELLLEQTILISLALPALCGLLWYYLRELKHRG